jgi:hypothetical protein
MLTVTPCAESLYEYPPETEPYNVVVPGHWPNSEYVGRKQEKENKK